MDQPLLSKFAVEGASPGELPRRGVPASGTRGGRGRRRVRGRRSVGHGRRVGLPDLGVLPRHDGHHSGVGSDHAPHASVALRTDPAGEPLRACHRTIDGKAGSNFDVFPPSARMLLWNIFALKFAPSRVDSISADSGSYVHVCLLSSDRLGKFLKSLS